AARCAAEYRAPAVRNRWHHDSRTRRVFVDLAGASQRDEVAEAVKERLAERRARQRVGILVAYAKFGLTSAGTGRHLLRVLIGNLGSPPAMPLVQLLRRNRLGHQLTQLGERVRPRTVYRPARSCDGRIGLRPADLATTLQSQVLELRRGQT